MFPNIRQVPSSRFWRAYRLLEGGADGPTRGGPEVPNSMLSKFVSTYITGEGPAYLVPNDLLSRLGRPTIWDHMVLP
jgi:hypothetical protein